MKKLFLFLFIPFVLSCNDKQVDYKYPTFIKAGLTDGTGIIYVDIVPDVNVPDINIGDYYTFIDTTQNLDLDKDGIADFKLRYFSQHYPYSTKIGKLEITPMEKNSICISKIKTNWAVPVSMADSLKHNDLINNNNNWSDSTALLFRWYVHDMTDTESGTLIHERTVDGYWYDNDNIYIGIKIVKDNNQIFGWIDMKGNVLRGYALTTPYLE